MGSEIPWDFRAILTTDPYIAMASIARKLNQHLTTNNQVVFITPTCAFFFSLRFKGFNMLQLLKKMVASRYSKLVHSDSCLEKFQSDFTRCENKSLYMPGNARITYKYYKKIKSRASESCCVSTLWASWIPRHLNILWRWICMFHVSQCLYNCA